MATTSVGPGKHIRQFHFSAPPAGKDERPKSALTPSHTITPIQLCALGYDAEDVPVCIFVANRPAPSIFDAQILSPQADATLNIFSDCMHVQRHLDGLIKLRLGLPQ